MELDGKVAVVTGPWQFPTTGDPDLSGLSGQYMKA